MKLVAFIFLVATCCTSVYAQYSEIWGVTFAGGEQDAGFLFRMDPDASNFEIKHHFDGIDGGKHPTGHLTEGPDGRIYGITTQGGLNDKGVIFSYDRGFDAFNVEYHLDVRIGASFLLAPDGLFYTLSSAFLGSLYRYDPLTKSLELEYDFSNSEGRNAFAAGEFTLVDDQLLYGTTSVGGDDDKGVLFEYNLNTREYVVRHHFEDSTGKNPLPFTVHLNNKLFGVASYGGNFSRGVLWEYDLATDTYTDRIHLESIHTRISGLTIGSDGSIYGSVSIGGSLSGGAIVKYNPSDHSLIFVHEFVDEGDPSLPTGSMLKTFNNKLFGSTRYGGTGEGLGVIYEYDLATKSANTVQNMNDGFPSESLLLEVGERTVTSVTIESSSNIIESDNGILELGTSLLPIEAKDQPVVWTVDDSEIASINSSGLLTAKGNGSVTVTATANFGLGVSDSIEIAISNQDDTPPMIPVESISLFAARDAITSFDSTLQLEAHILPIDATESTVSWSVSDGAIATISSTGLLTPISAGKVTVTATANDGSGIETEREISISNFVTSISITPLTSTIDVGRGTIDFDAIVQPTNATNQTIEWSIDPYSWASIDQDGVLTALRNGTVTVTAKSTDGSSVLATHEVTLSKQDLYQRVTSVSMSPSTSTIETDAGTLQFSAAVSPDDATNKTIEWVSTNEAVATVDETGLVTAVGNGKSNIVARSADGPSSIRFLRVSNQIGGPFALTAITLVPEEHTIDKRDGSVNLLPQLEPANTSDTEILWFINDDSIVTISEDGVVNAHGNGTTTVAAYTYNLYGDIVMSNPITISVTHQKDPLVDFVPVAEWQAEKLQVSYQRYSPEEGVEITYEISSDLVTWVPLAPETDYQLLSVTEHGDGMETIAFELINAMTGRFFIRVKAVTE